jgi:hypothetical protein
MHQLPCNFIFVFQPVFFEKHSDRYSLYIAPSKTRGKARLPTKLADGMLVDIEIPLKLYSKYCIRQ